MKRDLTKKESKPIYAQNKDPWMINDAINTFERFLSRSPIHKKPLREDRHLVHKDLSYENMTWARMKNLFNLILSGGPNYRHVKKQLRDECERLPG